MTPAAERLLEWWRRNRDKPVALRRALFFAGGGAILAFAIGRWHPEEEYRRLRGGMESLRADVRELAAARENADGEIRRLRLASTLGEKTASRLRGRIEELTAESLRRREEAIFYRRVLGAESQPSLNVYALEETPDFHPDHRRFSAVLIFPRTEFSGGYYFEAVAREDGESRLVRVPASGNAPLEFDGYGEIEQTVALPSAAEIAKLRLVVENARGEVEAEQEIEASPDI
ncbi:MAG: hypothetical protein ACR2QC_11060 [Gammaproteobacteria bacterium]